MQHSTRGGTCQKYPLPPLCIQQLDHPNQNAPQLAHRHSLDGSDKLSSSLVSGEALPSVIDPAQRTQETSMSVKRDSSIPCIFVDATAGSRGLEG